MATRTKTNFVFVVPTRFYAPKRLAEIYGMDVKLVCKNALIAGAMYQIGAKKLINRARLEKFLMDMGDFTVEAEGKYIQMNEAEPAGYRGKETHAVCLRCGCPYQNRFGNTGKQRKAGELYRQL